MYKNLKSNICFILCTVILERTLNVILGFIPRIHLKHILLISLYRALDSFLHKYYLAS